MHLFLQIYVTVVFLCCNCQYVNSCSSHNFCRVLLMHFVFLKPIAAWTHHELYCCCLHWLHEKTRQVFSWSGSTTFQPLPLCKSCALSSIRQTCSKSWKFTTWNLFQTAEFMDLLPFSIRCFYFTVLFPVSSHGAGSSHLCLFPIPCLNICCSSLRNCF